LEIGTDVKVGDIVILVEDIGARNNWPLLEKIKKIYSGRDEITRFVDVKTCRSLQASFIKDTSFGSSNRALAAKLNIFIQVRPKWTCEHELLVNRSGTTPILPS